MNQAQLSLFRSITLDYFAKLSPEGSEAPELGEPYMLFGEPLALDYTSLVRIHGEYQGCVYITAPAGMLRQVLRLHGEPDDSPGSLVDMSRELSNILAGNASSALGDGWEISVPVSLSPDDFAKFELPEATFIMPIHWSGAEAYLVVGLLNPEAEAAAVRS